MTLSSEATVFVVDDDDAVRESLRWLIGSVGLAVEAYPGAAEFLAAAGDDRPGCIVLDVRMPGVMGGLELQQRLSERGALWPVIILTGHGDVPLAVRALQAGAFDFIEKPFNDQHLLDRIYAALRLERERRTAAAARADAAARLATLTKRERDVLAGVLRGYANKRIALTAGMAEKTVEVHRANLMRKLRVDSVPALCGLVSLVDPSALGGDHPSARSALSRDETPDDGLPT